MPWDADGRRTTARHREGAPKMHSKQHKSNTIIKTQMQTDVEARVPIKTDPWRAKFEMKGKESEGGSIGLADVYYLKLYASIMQNHYYYIFFIVLSFLIDL